MYEANGEEQTIETEKEEWKSLGWVAREELSKTGRWSSSDKARSTHGREQEKETTWSGCGHEGGKHGRKK